MKIKVLGTGCPKCKKLYAEAEKAIAASGVKVDLEKVENIVEIIQYGVMATPGLVVNEEVKASGRIPQSNEIVSWIAAAAKSAGRLKPELKKYTKPALLILDELGYLPIDKTGADLLFQVISLRYEQGAIIVTSNRAFKEWPKIFNNDNTLTSAILDRLLHHADTVIIEGKSFRMKDRLES
jgi:small redox-active disulfide protein 2